MIQIKNQSPKTNLKFSTRSQRGIRPRVNRCCKALVGDPISGIAGVSGIAVIGNIAGVCETAGRGGIHTINHPFHVKQRFIDMAGGRE